jgi:glutamine cyclotransferase
MSGGSSRSKAGDPALEQAEVVREYGPYPDAEQINGVSYDGKHVWFATGDKLHALDPSSGEHVRALDVACPAGTAFDGQYLYQLNGGRIDKIDPATGEVLSSVRSPGQADDNAGLTWAEGTLWVAQHRSRKIIQIDPNSGAILRSFESDRFVTGVTFSAGELWHATLQDGQSELRKIDADSGRVQARLQLPAGVVVTGLESDGAELFFCGGGTSGRVRAVRKPVRR